MLLHPTNTNSSTHKVERWLCAKSDECLGNYFDLVKAALAILCFLLLVVVWDTLPTSAPVEFTDAHVVYDKSERTLHVTEVYEISKLVKFSIKRTVYDKTDTTHSYHMFTHMQGKPEMGPYTEKASLVITLTPGMWCIDREVEWVNGLSLRPHSRRLPTSCMQITQHRLVQP